MEEIFKVFEFSYLLLRFIDFNLFLFWETNFLLTFVLFFGLRMSSVLGKIMGSFLIGDWIIVVTSEFVISLGYRAVEQAKEDFGEVISLFISINLLFSFILLSCSFSVDFIFMSFKSKLCP